MADAKLSTHLGLDQLDAHKMLATVVESLPPNMKVEITASLLAQLLRAAGGGRVVPMDKHITQERVLPSATELLEHGDGEITVAEASEVLGITRQAVLNAIHRGALRSRKVGRRLLLVDVRSVKNYKVRGEQPSLEATNSASRLDHDLRGPQGVGEFHEERPELQPAIRAGDEHEHDAQHVRAGRR